MKITREVLPTIGLGDHVAHGSGYGEIYEIVGWPEQSDEIMLVPAVTSMGTRRISYYKSYLLGDSWRLMGTKRERELRHIGVLLKSLEPKDTLSVNELLIRLEI